MGKRECDACGEEFGTLTELRIHEKDDCPGRAVYDEADPNADDAPDRVTAGLLTCRSCDRQNPDADFEQTPSYDGEDYHLIVEFTCRFCGFDNENRMVGTGVDESDLKNLPPHLQP